MNEPESPSSLRKSPYTVLFITLLLLLVVGPVVSKSDLSPLLDALVHGLFFTLMLGGVLYAVRSRRGRAWFLGLLAFAFLTDWADNLIEGPEATYLGLCVSAAFLACVSVLVIKRVFAPGRVTADRIVAAFCGYLFLGMLWGNLYEILWNLDHGAISFPGVENPVHSDFTYYSFVTLTTLGYGEIHAVEPMARSLSYIEAMTGQLYLAVVIARLVALEIIDSQRRHSDQSSSS